jgi:hypothetical protein
MSTHIGADRIAIVGDKYTIKVARSHPKLFGTTLHSTMERVGVRRAVDDWNKFDSDQLGSFRRMLFHGIAANRREHRIAKRFGQIVVPTMSLLGGIANIQPTSQSVDLDFTDIWRSFTENLGPKTTKLGHMMEDVNNFGIYENRVMFVDGGSKGLEELLDTHAADIEKSLGSVGGKLGLSQV